LVTGKRQEPIGVARIGNPRVDRHARLLELAHGADASLPFAKLCERLDRHEAQGIHPEILAGLGDEIDAHVAISWASCRRDGSYDAVFLPGRSPLPLPLGHISWPRAAAADTVCLASEPGKSERCARLAESLKAHCAAGLPEPLVPDSIYVVDSLPNAADGSLDTAALLSFHQAISRNRIVV
jgi:hypothetical protein